MAKPTGRPNGRPPKFSQKLADDICSLLIDGKSLRKVGKELGFTMQSFFRWTREHEGFSEQYTIAKQEQCDMLVEDILDIADETHHDVQRAKLRVDTRKWIASKMKPKKYGDFQRQEVSGGDKPIIIGEISDKELNDRIKQLIK